MELRELKELLNNVADGAVSPDDAASRLRTQPYTELGYAKVDNQRGIRQGVSEIIYGEGKTAQQIEGICNAMLAAGQQRILITRLSADKCAQLSNLPLEYHELPRLGIIGGLPEPDGNGTVVVAAAGTSDLPVAEEAAFTAQMAGSRVKRLYDVGVAGLHRLLDHADDIADAQVIVCVAGMEGALASVIGGLASCPVIAVPTSVGYGASFGGLSALLAMLNTCASGVSVVNIDNGFGAGYQASMIDHVRATPSTAPQPGCATFDELGTLHLDLTTNATRGCLECGFMALLSDSQRARVQGVVLQVPAGSHMHDLAAVKQQVEVLGLDPAVKRKVLAIYNALARAEASVHGCRVEEAHFHEVGNGEALITVLVVCLAHQELGSPRVVSSAVQTGSGKVRCAHGVLDIPAPATAALLHLGGIPTCAKRLEGELCTPVSAAILCELVDAFE